MNELNPYSTPTVESVVLPTSDRPPIFCLVVFSASLLLCFLRVPFLALDWVGHGMGYDAALEPTIIPGIVSSAGIIIFGCIGNMLLIGRVSWGVPIAACLILSVAASIGVEIWVTLIARSLPDYRVTKLNDFLCIAVPLLRIILLIVYSVALAVFRRWSVRSRLPTSAVA
jgi:hypothetical protein